MTVVDRLLELPLVYSLWQAPFARQKFKPVERQLADVSVRRVLDVGCGPGTNAGRFSGADYVGIDINEDYLVEARRNHPGRFIRADLATSDLSALGTFDVILVNSFLHHLPDREVHALLARVYERLAPGGHIHILELVRPPNWSLGRLMARLDRGKYARPIEQWQSMFSGHFAPRVVEPYFFGGRLWSMVYFQGARR